MKIGLLTVSSLTLAALAWAAISENVLAEWRRYREAYQRVLRERATDERGERIARAFSSELQQIVLPDGRIDRCITCHTGIDDPRMVDAPQPFTTHPGRYLEIHEPAQFGCTVCHEGQGRATEKDDAHGRVPFWDRPLLEARFTKTTCTKCHSRQDLFGSKRWVDAADDGAGREGEGGGFSSRLLDRGWRLVQAKGCLGCHELDGKGGTLGPRLTSEGEKTRHEFSFARLGKGEEHTVVHWHREHFQSPSRVVAGSQMPNLNLTADDAEALTAVMLSLRDPGPWNAWRISTSSPNPRSGAELYSLYCSACHGPDGRGSAIPWIPTPSLNNDDVLGVADDDYFARIIRSGRRGTQMPAWGAGHGNLSDTEISRIVEYIRSWQRPASEPHLVRAENGDPEVGRRYYRGLCANCHGEEGEGGIGVSLNSPTFQAVASDRFLAETIARGRPGTAMPAWAYLSTQAISDLVAYVRTWRSEPPSYDDVAQALLRTKGSKSVQIGRRIYSDLCAGCHGVEGEGGLGVRLRTPSLLQVADDRFLYRAIVFGRPGTAMPAWRHLKADDVAALLAYLRSWQDGPVYAVRSSRRRGDHIAGESYYRIACAQCHGARGEGAVGPQLSNPVLLDSASDDMLFHWIAHGRQGTAMRGFLPEAQGPVTLTARQIEDVIAYLRHETRGFQTPVRRLGAGDPALGANLYQSTCASCHGRHGEGASGPQLNNPAFLHAASDGFLAATVILGRDHTAMAPMVRSRQGVGQIDPAQVPDLVAFLRSWEVPAQPRSPGRFVDMTDHAIRTGGRLFQSHCAACHGPEGRGSLDGPEHYAPALNNPDFLAAVSDGFLVATIARGRRGTPMRPFGQSAGGISSLSTARIQDLVSYIRSWELPSPTEERQLAAAGGTEP